MQRKGMIISLQLWWGKIAAVIPPVEVKCANSTKKRRQICRDLFFCILPSWCFSLLFNWAAKAWLEGTKEHVFFHPFSTSVIQSFLHIYLGPALHFLLHSHPGMSQLSSTLMRTTWGMAQSTHKHMSLALSHVSNLPGLIHWAAPHTWDPCRPHLGAFPGPSPMLPPHNPEHRQRRHLGVWTGTKASFSIHSILKKLSE